MNKEQIQIIIDNEPVYDKENEHLLASMLGDFYNHNMILIVAIVWGFGLASIALAIFSGIMFFFAVHTQMQIMWAVIFLCSVQFLGMIKVFAWQVIHRNAIKREIKRLELRIAQMDQKISQDK